jgi:predicted glycosyltransferase
LRLHAGSPEDPLEAIDLPGGPIILCQVGGGQDGAALAEAFVQTSLPAGATGVLLTGPYLPHEVRERLYRQVADRGNLRILDFLAEPGRLLRRAGRVISMGGYNTVCEILSYQKTALIVPRVHPRREQRIRAERLSDLGLLDILLPEHLSPQALGDWLHRELPQPRLVQDRFNWKGLDQLPRLLDELLAAPPWKVRRHFSDTETFHVTR